MPPKRGQPRRRYTHAEKATAILAAAASSKVAASEATGIPRKTIAYWLDKPEYARLRQNAREEMAAEARVVARQAWRALSEAIERGDMEPRDLVFAVGVAVDKAQLLAGQATSRTETKDLTGGLTDHEREQLRDVLDKFFAESAASDPVGAEG